VLLEHGTQTEIPGTTSTFWTRASSIVSPDQQSGIHCLIICGIRLLTPNNLGGT